MTVKKNLLPIDLQMFAEEPVVPETVVEPEQTVEPVAPEPEKTVEPVVPVETEIEPEPEGKSEIEAMAEMIATLTEKVTELSAKKEPETTVDPEQAIDHVAEDTEKVNAYEKALDKVLAEKLTNIPETIRVLMPDGISTVDKLEWVDKAAKAIPEPTKEPEKTVIPSIGKPTPVQTTVAEDVKKLTPLQKMKLALDEQLNKK